MRHVIRFRRAGAVALMVACVCASGTAQAPVRRPVGATLHAATRATVLVATESRQDSVAPHHHPYVAAALSAVVPGAGQIYAGEPGRGVTFLAIAGGSLALAWNVHRDIGNVGAIVSMGTYLYAIVDAPQSVRRVAQRAARRKRMLME